MKAHVMDDNVVFQVRTASSWWKDVLILEKIYTKGEFGARCRYRLGKGNNIPF